MVNTCLFLESILIGSSVYTVLSTCTSVTRDFQELVPHIMEGIQHYAVLCSKFESCTIFHCPSVNKPLLVRAFEMNARYIYIGHHRNY